MGYHEKSYTTKNNDVVILTEVIEEFCRTTRHNEVLGELAEKLKGFDLSITSDKTFSKNIEVFSNLYRYFVKFNCMLLHNGKLLNKSQFEEHSIRYTLRHVLDLDFEKNTIHKGTDEYQEALFINGYGCSLVSLISLAHSSKFKITMLPMFKMFLEDFNNFLDVTADYDKIIVSGISNDRDFVKHAATFKHLKEKAQVFGKLDYYTVSSINAIKNNTTNANTEFTHKPKSIFTWESEYEFSLLNKFAGPEVLIKVILLLALNSLSIVKKYYLNVPPVLG